ncbi:MAG: endolytic transglycosylase MltG [Defluviitaleaceae bacterium]|nr:endolytic transglycosylase MltG [Defluviitaleaceae bacterium]
MNKHNKTDAADTTVNILKYVLGMLLNLVLVAVVAVFVVSAFGWGHSEGIRLAGELLSEGENHAFEFVIDEEISVSDLARRLHDEEIIQNRMVYQLELFVRGATANYSPGTFALNMNMSNVEIDRTLRRQARALAPHETITIPPGWTLRDMAAYFESREFFAAEDFLFVAQYGHFGFAFLMDIPADRPNRLEGYLFPDTYQIPVNPIPADIITRMLHNFSERIDEEMFFQMEEMGLTLDETIIMASIIEREARLASEQPLMSQVIHRRMQTNMRLDMDSTVKYAMADPPVRLTIADIDRYAHSPYNTYRHHGLPAGPISNPAAGAIRATLWPSATDYLFFVLRDEATGAHHFSRTYPEHQAAAERYLWNRDR